MKKNTFILFILLSGLFCIAAQEATNTEPSSASAVSDSIVLPGANVMFESLLQLGPLSLLAAFVLAGSYLVRASAMNNRIIPWLAAVIGAVSLEFMFPRAGLSQWQHPWFIIGLYGFIVSVGVWMVHEFALSRVEDLLAARGLFPKRLTLGGNDADKKTVIEHAKLMSSQAEQMEPGLDKEYTNNVANALKRLAG